MSKIKTEADLIQSSIEILNKVLPKYPKFTGVSNQQLVNCLDLFNNYNESVGLDTLLKDVEQINLSLENGFTSIPELTTIERNIRQFINPTLQPELLSTNINPSSNEKTELSIRQAIVDTFNKQFLELKNQIVSQVANEFRKFNKQNPESGNLDKEVITALNNISTNIENKLHELANLEADTIAKITKKIGELGARPAFPPQMAMDQVAAHFLPEPGKDIVFSDQLIKLDVGVCYNGAIGDCAVTIDLSGKHQGLIDAAEDALLSAEQSIKVGMPIREIGSIIEATIRKHGFKAVRNLAGHGLGYYKTHTMPMFPNYDDHSRGIIKPGMTFAIEPFATDGCGSIFDAGNPTIFSFIKTRPAKSETAKLILKQMKEFNGLPFAIHDFIDKGYSKIEAKRAFQELLELEAIEGYAPLIEEKQGMVAQAENSILVDKDGSIFITTR